MKKALYLFIAVIGNGLGSALMFQADLGMSAWGSAAANVSNAITFLSPGEAFIILGILFYIVALIIHKKVILYDLVLSLLFLVSFSTLLDFFLFIIPDFSVMEMWIRLLVSVIGLLILLFAIAIHLHVNIAVHPMDVYLKVMQEEVFKNVVKGTYFAYFSAFIIAILFGLWSGDVTGLGPSTILTLIFGGTIMGLYNKYIIRYL